MSMEIAKKRLNIRKFVNMLIGTPEITVYTKMNGMNIYLMINGVPSNTIGNLTELDDIELYVIFHGCIIILFMHLLHIYILKDYHTDQEDAIIHILMYDKEYQYDTFKNIDSFIEFYANRFKNFNYIEEVKKQISRGLVKLIESDPVYYSNSKDVYTREYARSLL